MNDTTINDTINNESIMNESIMNDTINNDTINNESINDKHYLHSTQTVIYSFVAGYMVSQTNLLGFALGCGFMFALQCMPKDIKILNSNIYNKIIKVCFTSLGRVE